SNPTERATALIELGKKDFDAKDYRAAAEHLREAAGMKLHGPKGFAARDEAARWQALAEARLAMQTRDLDSAETRLRDSIDLGIDPKLTIELQRELIKAQSAARLKDQFSEDVDAESATTVPATTEPQASAPSSKTAEEATTTSQATLANAANERMFAHAMEVAKDALKRREYEEGPAGGPHA